MTETTTKAGSRPRAIGHREFTWFTPAGRHATDYENLTVGQQSSPAEWLHVGWPVHFDDGRAPFTEDSTSVRSSHWRDWRDPFQVWQRPYVQNTNFEEQALEHLTPIVLDTGIGQVNKAWLREVLGKYYAAWPFAEYGLFLSLCYAVREALADTIMFATAFEAPALSDTALTRFAKRVPTMPTPATKAMISTTVTQRGFPEEEAVVVNVVELVVAA